MPRSLTTPKQNAFNRALGDLVRKERARHGFNQAQLAPRLGISRSALANIEVGRQQITVSQLCRIAAALGIDPAHLIPQEPARALSSIDGIAFPPELPLHARQAIADTLGKPPHATPPQTAAPRRKGRLAVSIDRMAEGAGAALHFGSLGNVQAALCRTPERTAIVVNSEMPLPRQRLAIAHELAHLANHPDCGRHAVHADKRFPVAFRKPAALSPKAALDYEATCIAVRILLPEAAIRPHLPKSSDLEDDRPLEALARKFQVTTGTLMFRLRLPDLR